MFRDFILFGVYVLLVSVKVSQSCTYQSSRDLEHGHGPALARLCSSRTVTCGSGDSELAQPLRKTALQSLTGRQVLLVHGPAGPLLSVIQRS